ncbi:sag-related sequence srs53f [Cystoisospora suis]|uniref:Sag-related sequence srs53f n=1 Tax=Cystoisospora suis TaxID=483139 RepID=A0A2C6KH31_9APIC|nr:sag-related sequence srs53f [Cystoisospora suis]
MGHPILIPCAAITAFAVSTSGVIANNADRLSTTALVNETAPVLRRVAHSNIFADYLTGLSEEAIDSARAVRAQPRRLSQSAVPQCKPTNPQGQQTLNLSPYSLEAKFDCGMATDSKIQVQPDCASPSDKCCDKAGDTCTLTIKDTVGVSGSVSKDEGSSFITVKLDDIPTKVDGKLYFKCTTTEPAGGKCIVGVNMPDALGESQCNFNKDVKLPAITEPNKETTFECGGTETTTPTEDQVFVGDGCTGEPSKLSDLVPGAALIKSQNGAFRLKVTSLPSKAQNLCFKCVYPDPRKGKSRSTATCKVTVAVSGTSKTTTASTTASAAVGIVVSWFAAVALVFFSSAGVC